MLITFLSFNGKDEISIVAEKISAIMKYNGEKEKTQIFTTGDSDAFIVSESELSVKSKYKEWQTFLSR